MKMETFNRAYHRNLGTRNTGNLYYEEDTTCNSILMTAPSDFDSEGKIIAMPGYLVAISNAPKRTEHISIRLEQ